MPRARVLPQLQVLLEQALSSASPCTLKPTQRCAFHVGRGHLLSTLSCKTEHWFLIWVYFVVWWRSKSQKWTEMKKSRNLFVGVSLSKEFFTGKKILHLKKWLNRLFKTHPERQIKNMRQGRHLQLKIPTFLIRAEKLSGKGLTPSPRAEERQLRLLYRGWADTHCTAGLTKED